MKLDSKSGQWPEETGDWRDCALTISFGSFATGPDLNAAATVDRLIRSDRSVARVTRSAYGREGEYSLCVRMRSKDDAIGLFEKLRESLRGPVRAPVTITGPHGSHSAPHGR